MALSIVANKPISIPSNGKDHASIYWYSCFRGRGRASVFKRVRSSRITPIYTTARDNEDVDDIEGILQ